MSGPEDGFTELPPPYSPSFDPFNLYSAGYDQSQEQITWQQPTASSVYKVQTPEVVEVPDSPRVLDRPRDLLYPAIVICLVCCIPVGMIAVIYSCQTQSAADKGDLRRAVQKQRWTIFWLVITIITGIVTITASVLMNYYIWKAVAA